MKGLQQTLVSSQVCNQDAFEAFVAGFNQANPRFTINDVHAGKEAADVKIKGEDINHELLSGFMLPHVQNISCVTLASLTHPRFSLEVDIIYDTNIFQFY